MALNFNPFEKDKPAPTPKTKDKHSGSAQKTVSEQPRHY
jgi:hypothetical protein